MNFFMEMPAWPVRVSILQYVTIAFETLADDAVDVVIDTETWDSPLIFLNPRPAEFPGRLKTPTVEARQRPVPD
ncbi:MAG: hypothetical protein R3F13_09300 [Prosthecobacter sp.]